MGQGSSRIKRSTEVREFRKTFTWSIRNWKALCGSSRTELISPEFQMIVRDECSWKRKYRYVDTVFENHRKSLIQHYERSELRLHLEWAKVY